ncbi:inorganic phosphate transporter [Staphylospora marina]|uniref:inorganic phosphate transporter n=1 Tax=Staphylospora marina TaxID=2490858 RepID=UPI000F5BEABA|nr:inorganic phosphate transporter [Staphylospora marina]
MNSPTIEKRRIALEEKYLSSITKSPLTGIVIATLTTFVFIATGLLPYQTLETVIGFIIVAWLAVENGGNDVSKGVAPLVSSGAAKEIVALVYGSLVTAVGGFLSIYLGIKLLKLFTGGIIGANYKITIVMALAMAAGAALWVAFATRFSLPVSTTHAIVGAVVVVGTVTYGFSSVVWSSLIHKVVLPLILSPALGLSIAWLLMYAISLLKIPENASRGLTWISSGAICFVRAVNDTPKIVAITVLVAMLPSDVRQTDSLLPMFLLVTVAMGIGSLVKGLSVTRLLSNKVTQLDNYSSVSAVLTTTALVLSSSQMGLPVSTTHVSTSAIIGAGVRKGRQAINWIVVRDMVLSWLVTLPGAGLLGAIAYYILRILIN